jgi:hypothetical protein
VDRPPPTAPSPINSAFISSVSRGFEDVRDHVRRGIESLEIEPVMFETRPAADAPSRDVLFEHIANSDVVLLVLGPSYGDEVESGKSATEEEFDEAERLGKPVLALLLAGDREPRQRQFVNRIRGSWTVGRFVPQFDSPDDAGYAAVRALRWLSESQAARVDLTAAGLDAIETFMHVADRPLRAFGARAMELAAQHAQGAPASWDAAQRALFESSPSSFYELFHLLYDKGAELGVVQIQATSVLVHCPDLRSYANHFSRMHALLTEAAESAQAISFLASVLSDRSAENYASANRIASERLQRLIEALDERQQMIYELKFDLDALRRGTASGHAA